MRRQRRCTGACGLVGAAFEPLQVDQSSLFGKTIMGVFEGDGVSQVLIP